MNKSAQPSYKKSFLLALGFHGLVLAVVVFNHISREAKPLVPVSDNKIISAHMITEIKTEIKTPERVKIAQVAKIETPKEAIKPEKDLKKNVEKIKLEKLEKPVKQEQPEKLIPLKKAKQVLKKEAPKLPDEAQVVQEAERSALLQPQQSSQDEQQQLLRMIDRYGLLIQAKIHQNWRRPVGMENLYRCKIAVKLRSNGEVISARVIDSSGNIEFDRSAELAVLKSSPLPMPPDEKMRTPFNQFTFTFDPETA